MPGPLKLKGGILSGLPSLATRELAFVTDRPRLYVGSGSGNRLVSVLEKIDATAAPTANDDSGDGYSVGTRWIDVTNDKAYVCVDDAVGAAVWKEIGAATAIADNSVTDAKLRDSAALSVIGRSANSTGDPGDIAAGTDGHVLRRSGTALGFGTLASGAFADNTIAPARLAFSATSRIAGRVTAGAGAGEELTPAQILALLSAFVGAGGTAAKGLVPAPGATSHANQPYFLGDDAAFHAAYQVLGTPAIVATDETTAATATPSALATAQNITFTLDENTNVLVLAAANYYDTAGAQSGFLYADLDGTPTIISGSTTNGANFLEMLFGIHRFPLVGTGAHTISAKYLVGGGTGHFRWRGIAAFRCP